LKKIDTFTNSPVSSWIISPSPDSSFIWYIDEDNDYPRLYWSYQPPTPPKNNSGGKGTGGATVVNTTPPQNIPVVDNAPQNITHVPDNTTPQNITPIQENLIEPKATISPWLLLLIGALLSIFIFFIILYKRRKEDKEENENQ